MVITQQAAQSVAALNRPVAAGVCTPSARRVDCICVGPTVLYSFGSIVAVLAYLTPLPSSGPRLLCVGIERVLPPTGDGNPRPLGGRPQIGKEVRDLIRRMSCEHPLWGAPKIHGELLKLGIEVAQSTVSSYMWSRPDRPLQTGKHFLCHQMAA